MNSARLWLTVASLIWFISGVSLGLLGAGLWTEPEPDPSPIEHYTDRMIAEFEMKPERARLFRHLMAGYQEEIERIKEQHIAEQRSAMEPELTKLGDRYTGLIRDKVLPESERAKFDALCFGTP